MLATPPPEKLARRSRRNPESAIAYTWQSARNKVNFGFIRMISLFIGLNEKVLGLAITGSAMCSAMYHSLK